MHPALQKIGLRWRWNFVYLSLFCKSSNRDKFFKINYLKKCSNNKVLSVLVWKTRGSNAEPKDDTATLSKDVPFFYPDFHCWVSDFSDKSPIICLSSFMPNSRLFSLLRPTLHYSRILNENIPNPYIPLRTSCLDHWYHYIHC